MPVTEGSMEYVDMYIDEPQQAEPEEDLDISEAGEEKAHNISQEDFLKLMLRWNSRQKLPG